MHISWDILYETKKVGLCNYKNKAHVKCEHICRDIFYICMDIRLGDHVCLVGLYAVPFSWYKKGMARKSTQHIFQNRCRKYKRGVNCNDAHISNFDATTFVVMPSVFSSTCRYVSLLTKLWGHNGQQNQRCVFILLYRQFNDLLSLEWRMYGDVFIIC